MGRPLNKKLFGPIEDTDVTPVGERWTEDGQNEKSYDTSGNARTDRTGYNIPVEQARITGGTADVIAGANETPYVLWQKGARRFKVRTADGDGFCKLVSGESALAEREMVLKGYVDGEGAGVPLRKLSGRKAYDFNSNAYTWYVDVKTGEDSTMGNTIILTAI